MDTPTLLELFRNKKINEGDTVTVCGRVGYGGSLIPPPYYFSEEEKRGYIFRFISHQELSEEKGLAEYLYSHNAFSNRLQDDYGYYSYDIFCLFPGDQLPDDCDEEFTINESGKAVHLMSFGIDFSPLFLITRHSESEEDIDYFTYCITGQIFIPKNVAECRLELGIGNLTELYRVDPNHSDITPDSFLPSPYDPRPQIDFSMFPKESHEKRIQDVLTETEMKRGDFNFILEK